MAGLGDNNFDDIFDCTVGDSGGVKEEDDSGTRETRLVAVVIAKFRRVSLL